MDSGIVISISFGSLLILGVLAVFFMRHKRKMKEAEYAHKKAVATPTPVSAATFLEQGPRDIMPLGRSVVFGQSFDEYKVEAHHHYSSVDEDGEPINDGEDWWEVQLRNVLDPDDLIYLSADRGEEDRVPYWVTSRPIPTPFAPDWFQKASFGAGFEPPETFTHHSETYETEDGEYDYKAYLETWIAGEHEQRYDRNSPEGKLDDYVRVTEWWPEEDASAEWSDEGRSITLETSLSGEDPSLSESRSLTELDAPRLLHQDA